VKRLLENPVVRRMRSTIVLMAAAQIRIGRVKPNNRSGLLLRPTNSPLSAVTAKRKPRRLTKSKQFFQSALAASVQIGRLIEADDQKRGRSLTNSRTDIGFPLALKFRATTALKTSEICCDSLDARL
jgi:hypothetical protein